MKPENVMIVEKDTTQIKLVDFGFAKCFNPNLGADEVLGTPLYIAPEILN
jgi:serine/threonine protein kinase